MEEGDAVAGEAEDEEWGGGVKEGEEGFEVEASGDGDEGGEGGGGGELGEVVVAEEEGEALVLMLPVFVVVEQGAEGLEVAADFGGFSA